MSKKSPENLIWLDMEMTGLDPINNVIIEVAVVITDAQLNILDQSESYAISQPQSELAKMDKWNVGTHTGSGLVERVKNDSVELNFAEDEIIKLVKKYVNKGISPLCGNTIHQDRKFITRYMPKFDEYLHYRNIDVSTIKELAKRWYPDVASKFEKHNKHQALADIIESIEELKYYRKNLMIDSVVTSNPVEGK